MWERNLDPYKAAEWNESGTKGPHYYNISKHLFYFFLAQYGGGRVVMKKADFLRYEVEKPRPADNRGPQRQGTRYQQQ